MTQLGDCTIGHNIGQISADLAYNGKSIILYHNELQRHKDRPKDRPILQESFPRGPNCRLHGADASAADRQACQPGAGAGP